MSVFKAATAEWAKPPPLANAHDSSRSLLLNSGESFALKKIDWLWPGWLARGKFHIFAGAKAAGKSTIAFDLMARLTSGGEWPDGTPVSSVGDAVIWSGEDGIDDTILPRFVAAGGNLKRIFPIKDIVVGGRERWFDPSTDMSMLIEAAEQRPELRLVAIDPVVMALPAGTDSHKNAETRRGLQPLVEFAERRGIALLGITHFSKGTEGADPIERITGTLAFGALPRIAWGASGNPDAAQRRLVRIASNIGPSGGGIEYSLFQTPLPDRDFSAQRVDWGRRLNGNARELLNTENLSAQAAATEFLRDFLAAGSQPQREIKDAAEAHGHAWGTVRRAQDALGVKPRKIGKAWHWELPEPPVDAEDAQMAHQGAQN
jgi:putative DNA primase/helicase